jgi:hypothetical protein
VHNALARDRILKEFSASFRARDWVLIKRVFSASYSEVKGIGKRD